MKSRVRVSPRVVQPERSTPTGVPQGYAGRVFFPGVGGDGLAPVLSPDADAGEHRGHGSRVEVQRSQRGRRPWAVREHGARTCGTDRCRDAVRDEGSLALSKSGPNSTKLKQCPGLCVPDTTGRPGTADADNLPLAASGWVSATIICRWAATRRPAVDIRGRQSTPTLYLLEGPCVPDPPEGTSCSRFHGLPHEYILAVPQSPFLGRGILLVSPTDTWPDVSVPLGQRPI